ncbi:MAG: hypothetical protein PHC28_09420 [Flavobacterium sp.]|uniref:hypothetical protein n=1 Tax=Flavobacterium sp. TaxID=239 RepID=UPI0026030BC2|nr:hypothetical protein [Flavobacterium sp.]MDD5150689.1 hypothetical protein [Flavobacterium sp.]
MIIERFIEIPIFGGLLDIIIDEDIVNRRIENNHLFGEYKSNQIPSAIFSYNGSRYGLFFTFECGIDEIVHEIFHLTFRIFQNINTKLDENTNEVFAYMQGYLMKIVLSVYEKNNINLGIMNVR